jgi:predicted HicB family RNase H-like nuclease
LEIADEVVMEYKGYIGQVEFDDETLLFHGRVINIRDVITFEGESVIELRKAFRESVDVYLDFCAERGNKEPDKPFSGQFVTRLSPDLHRRASLAASLAGKSLNAWVAEQLETATDQSAVIKGYDTKHSETAGTPRRTSTARKPKRKRA